MTEILKTVTIETKNGAIEINATDYDAKVHTLYGKKKATKKKAAK